MWLQWIWEGLVSGAQKVATLWWLVPLFIVIQVLRDSGWLEKASGRLKPLLAPLRLPGDASIPVLAGLTVGLTYGAGVILQTAEEGRLNRNELTVVCVLLGVCHAIIEETILFTAVGVNGLLLLLIRFGLGILFALGASRFMLAPLGQVNKATRAARG